MWAHACNNSLIVHCVMLHACASSYAKSTFVDFICCPIYPSVAKLKLLFYSGSVAPRDLISC